MPHSASLHLGCLQASAFHAIDLQPRCLSMPTAQVSGHIEGQAARVDQTLNQRAVLRPSCGSHTVHRQFHRAVISKRSQHLLTTAQAAS